MPFFRPLSETAPRADRNLPWPIVGLSYVVTFMGPMPAGLMIGTLARDWLVSIVGLMIGIGITFLNGWLMDKIIDPVVAKFQRSLLKRFPYILVNIAAFVWAITLCALSMLAPLVLFGTSILNRIR
jgi:predicted lipid-binding transport protein (Tim44 family)